MLNENGLPQHLREVTHEANVTVEEDGESKNKKPDYAFRIGTELLFYLETKKSAVDITSDILPAFQLRRYGWSGNLKISVLTNFTDLWDELLEEYDEIIHIPMSSGLSSTCSTATMLAQDYDGKVFVVDNQRISVTQRQSVMDAMELAAAGKSGQEIYDKLMENKMESSIYIMLDTLYYLKKGGRITPAAAALGTLLKLKPVLQIQGEKLDAFAKARTVKQAKNIMIKQIKDDCERRFGSADGTGVHISMAYTHDLEAAEEFKKEVQEAFPNHEIVLNPLSLSIACHIGPGALAVTATKAIEVDA